MQRDVSDCDKRSSLALTTLNYLCFRYSYFISLARKYWARLKMSSGGKLSIVLLWFFTNLQSCFEFYNSKFTAVNLLFSHHNLLTVGKKVNFWCISIILRKYWQIYNLPMLQKIQRQTHKLTMPSNCQLISIWVFHCSISLAHKQ
jgi:hypothetical protein